MSKAELEVVLATPGPFVPGGVIEGFVGVTVNTSCRCRGLTVTLEWYTHGRGNRKTGTAQTVTVFDGDLVAGEKGLHPFSLTVPPGPFTYNGTKVSVGWRVRANADLPWAFDPKTETSIVLHPGDAPLDVVKHGPNTQSLAKLTKSHDSVILIVGALFLVAPLIFLVPIAGMFGLGCLVRPTMSTVIPALVTLGMGSAFAYVIYRVVKPAVLRLVGGRRLSEFEVVVPDTISPGETIEVRLRVTPRGDLLVEEVRVELVLREIAVSGAGTKKTTHSHVQTVASVVLDRPGTLLQRRPVTFSGTLTVPDSIGCTFGAMSNSVLYQLKGVVDCPGPFDAEQSAYVTVVPANLIRGR